MTLARSPRPSDTEFEGISSVPGPASKNSSREVHDAGAPSVVSTARPKELHADYSEVPPAPKTKILHMVVSLEVGGTETQLVQVAKRLDPRLYDVRVGCLRAVGPLVGSLLQAGIQVLEFPTQGPVLSPRGFFQLFRLAQYIRKERIDVVHSHDLWANLISVPAARLARAPIVITSQRNMAHLSWYTPFRRKIVRLIHLLANHVVANSDAIKRLLAQDFRIPPERVHVLRNGVDFERIARARGDRLKLFPALSQKAKLVIHVANMNSEVKGHAILIEAAKDVCTVVPEAAFILVGDGPLRSQLEEQVRRVGIWDHFTFLGRRKDVPEILSCGDLFVLPSFAEGLPNSVLEASAAGLPIVATSVGGIPEIIEDGATGLLIPPENPQALCAAILQLLKNPAFAAAVARAGKERVSSQFCFDIALAGLKRLYSRPSS